MSSHPNGTRNEPKHGPSGMIYWRHESLRRLATIEEVTDSIYQMARTVKEG